ncbi:hypothetical protein H4R35_003237 [Dimargaris xerosporica]|nr:hypothetical protein H4R35_003237 [Dimargaris xerosporica]
MAATALLAPLHLQKTVCYALNDSYVFDLAWVPSALDHNANASPQRLAVSASDHQIQLFDPVSLTAVQHIGFHTDTIHHIGPVMAQPHLFLSASADGSAAIWDLRLAGFSPKSVAPVQTFCAPNQSKAELYCADINSAGMVLAVGTQMVSSEACIHFWDLRQSPAGAADTKASTVTNSASAPLTTYAESHSDDITQVRFHPTHEHTLLSGSEDGLLCLFNLTQADEEDALVAAGNTCSTVNRLGWFGPQAEYVYALSPLQSFSLWSIDNDGMDTIHQWANIRDLSQPLGQTQAAVEFGINCHYNPISQRLFLATGSNSGQLHVFHVGINSIDLCQVLQGGHRELVRSVAWSPSQQALISGGEDARLCLWRDTPAPVSGLASPQPLSPVSCDHL